MRRVSLACLLLIHPAAAVAQPAERVDVTLASFKFAPATIRLHHGQRYVLRLTNSAGSGHDFAAETFFAAAQLEPDSPVRKGAIEVDGGEAKSVAFTAPAAGRYPVHCTHFMHGALGMKGEIVVD